MRLLEIALTTSLIPYVVYLLSPWRTDSAWLLAFPLISVVLMVCHLFVEGYRWHMGLAYALTLFVVSYQLSRIFLTVHIPYLVGVGALLCLMSAIVLSTLAPVFELPLPTGPYKIGTDIRHIVDRSRRDPQADVPYSPREIMVQIWYPVDTSVRGQFAPYRERILTNFRNARLSLVTTHSVLGAPLAESQDRYPALIFAPSWRGQRTENTFHSEELASHGYIVVAMDHPFSTSKTAFPDGRMAHSKLMVDEDYSSDDALNAFVGAAEEQVDIRTRDASFVLNWLAQQNENDPEGILTRRVDLDRIGILGFSIGGAVAAEACRLDRRFRAGVGMDGMLAGESAKDGTTAPFFFIMAKELSDSESVVANLNSTSRREMEFSQEQYRKMQRSLAQTGGYWMTLAGASHSNFSDLPFYAPLRVQTLAGSVDAERTARIISRYIIAFFDQQLKGIEQALLVGPSPSLPEVQFKIWRAQKHAMDPGQLGR